MPGPIIPSVHMVARHCRPSDFAYGGPNGEPTGINESAFRIKSGDIGLSVIWVDYFAGTHDHKLNCVRSVINRAVRDTHRLAIVRVSVINAALSSAGITPEVREDPSDDPPPDANAAHALIMPSSGLTNTIVRTAIASSVQPSDLVSAKLSFAAPNHAH
jgi:hypothetical protein